VTGLLIVAAMLVLWAGIAAIRRRQEEMPRGPSGPSGPRGPRQTQDDDEIDRETLEQAEREVRDLDAMQRPDDGFEGDDWGPGAGKRL
jgi:hypothetical protein